jgi:environmental stress-induced protein Ves
MAGETRTAATSTSAPGSLGLMDNGYLQEKLNDAQLKFEKACTQIVLLDQKIKDLEVRYKRALKNKKNSFRYNLRLRLSVVTGVKMMYHHYASTKADELHRLHRQRHAVMRNPSDTADTSSDTREDV